MSKLDKTKSQYKNLNALIFCFDLLIFLVEKISGTKENIDLMRCMANA